MPPYFFTTIPLFVSRLRTVSLGWAPLSSQYSIRSRFSETCWSVVLASGSYHPSSSRTRPSRGRCESTALIRKNGRCRLPNLFNRNLTAKVLLRIIFHTPQPDFTDLTRNARAGNYISEPFDIKDFFTIITPFLSFTLAKSGQNRFYREREAQPPQNYPRKTLGNGPSRRSRQKYGCV